MCFTTHQHCRLHLGTWVHSEAKNCVTAQTLCDNSCAAFLSMCTWHLMTMMRSDSAVAGIRGTRGGIMTSIPSNEVSCTMVKTAHRSYHTCFAASPAGKSTLPLPMSTGPWMLAPALLVASITQLHRQAGNLVRAALSRQGLNRVGRASREEAMGGRGGGGPMSCRVLFLLLTHVGDGRGRGNRGGGGEGKGRGGALDQGWKSTVIK